MSEWRFLLDENVDPKTASYLRKEKINAEHVREALWQGAAGEDDVLPYARDNDLVIVTSDVKDFGDLSEDGDAGVVLLHDDTTPAYQVASALIAMVDAYPSRDAFDGREILDAWT